jgi:hypothetical protein
MSSDFASDSLNSRLGPHKVPKIKCKNCGRENHYDHALSEEGMPGVCPNCNSFLREPTDEEHEKFTDFLVWNSRHLDAATDQSGGDQ